MVCSGGAILPAVLARPSGRTTPLLEDVVRSVQIEEPSGFTPSKRRTPSHECTSTSTETKGGKETHMTTRPGIIVGLGGVASLVGAPPVRAQSDGMRAVIPFEFKAGKTTLPAGTYTVSQQGATSNALQLRTLRGGV